MLDKTIDKLRRKEKRASWIGYYPRITKDKTRYCRKIKHKNNLKEY